ncbi:MAG TPA: tagaturonate reductase, partial [Longimicrobium sp.]|nr:tagaturonate reductase [Longimicrobium sp.]
ASRALAAADVWGEVLALARDPALALVFSNTTEIGITLDEGDRFDGDPPRSFPGKLTRFLWERARAFDFDPSRGLVVLPCELVAENGKRLRETVLALAARWELGDDFVRWIDAAVPFCDTLVDRIVPGTPAPAEHAAEEAELGYADALLTVAEEYALFAIEAGDEVRARLPFAGDPRVVVADDIAPYRERKLRLLNGAHTALTPLALLCGRTTVREAVDDARLGAFLRRMMLDEIAPHVDAPDARAYAGEVLERFANPFIRHELADIALQQTMKLRVRVVPSMVDFARAHGAPPSSLAFAFAAYLRFLRGDVEGDGKPPAADDQAEPVRALWSRSGDPATVARAACADAALWGADLAALPGFADTVAEALERIVALGANVALERHLARPAPVSRHPAVVGG